LLFADQLAATHADARAAIGVALALAGTFFFSLGNLASFRAVRGGTTMPNAVARAMLWGTAALTLFILARGQSFAPEITARYLGALIYLALVASAVGFLAYLALAARIGTERAAYVTVVSPTIALAISTGLENYTWSLPAIIGLPLILLGNVVIFAPMRRSHQAVPVR